MIKQDAGAKGLQAAAGRALSTIPLTPNQWTLLSVALAALAALSAALTGELWLALALFASAAACDVIDGAVARARKEQSAFGGFMDGVADRFVEGFFLLSFMFVPLAPLGGFDAKSLPALALFLGTCMPSFIRAYADHKGVVAREQALALGGVCERGERVILLISGLAAGLALGMEWFSWSLAAVSALSAVTILQRLMEIRRIARENQPKVSA